MGSILGLAACAAQTRAKTVAVYTPPRSASAAQIAIDTVTLTKRLRAIGSSDAVSARGASLVVTGAELPVPATSLGQPGHFYLRSVLCGAPAYSPTAKTSLPAGRVPACHSQYALTVSNLAVTPNSSDPKGYTSNTLPPDPVFAAYPSTPLDNPESAVLLPVDAASGVLEYPRCILGRAIPRAMNIASASTRFDTVGHMWVVDFTLTPTGSGAWDRAAKASFHQFLAIDVDGIVKSAGIVEPNQIAFTSFGGKGEIPGNSNSSEAKALAALLVSGPLVTPLRVTTGR